MLDTLTSAHFSPHLNETFNLSTGEAAFDAELVEVEVKQRPRGGRPGINSPACFALIFAAPPDAPVQQQSFAVSHPKLGTLEIFLVPHAPLADGRLVYEAVFN